MLRPIHFKQSVSTKSAFQLSRCLCAVTFGIIVSLFAAGCAYKDTFTDPRDSKTYKTVKIGNQTWMAENLNYNTSDGAGSWCYENSPEACAGYGRLYDWNTAMTACPAGWHLPSNEEWDTLINIAGDSSTAGTKLKSRKGWSSGSEVQTATDNCKFSAISGGSCSDGGFYGLGHDGYWWTASEYNDSAAYYRYMFYSREGAYGHYGGKSYGVSVRCVKD